MENQNLKILVVSPKDKELLQIESLLEKCDEFGLEIFSVKSYEETIMLKKSEAFVIAFVSSLFQIKEFSKALKVPIVALVKNSKVGESLLSNGATDYLDISKLSIEDLKRVLRYSNSLFKSYQKLEKRKSHFEVLFENSPNSLWEEDFSQLKIFLDSLVEQGITNFKKYFKQNPNKLIHCLSLIKIIAVNEETVKLFDASNKGEILNHLSTFFTNESLQTFLEEIVAFYNGQTTFETETINKDLKGRLIHVRLKLFIPEIFRDNWGRVFISITNITNLIRVKKELSEKSDKLNLTNAILEREIQDRKIIQDSLKKSNDDLAKFAYSASHDLQEPLRTISGFLGILERKHKNELDSDSLLFIDLCLQNSSRMQKMIESLLQYSRVRTGEKELKNIDLNLVLDAIIVQHLQLTIKQSEAEITFSKMPTILANKYEMFALFQNLISNAIKFVPSERVPKIKIDVEQKNREWLFSIEDNGIGIEPEKSELIFTIFKRLHSRTKFQGSGIGLATCKKIIESYQSKIWFKPNPNAGTTFFFTFPFPT